MADGARSALAWVRWRMLAALVIVGLAGSCMGTLTLTRDVARGVARQLRIAFEPVTEADLDACEVEPETWQRSTARWEAFAYNADRTSVNPAAPPFDPQLELYLWLGDDQSARFFPNDERWHGAIAWGTGRPGACAVVMLHYRVREDMPAILVRQTAIATLLMVMVSTWLALVVAVRPLLRALERLMDATDRVGRVDYVSPVGAAQELAPLARVLDEAHGRVVEERSAEEARRAALERHLADVAHDLRTPLAALQLRLEAIRAGDDQVDAAVEDVVYVGMLTENLHLASRFRDGGPARASATCDLGAVVERVAARFSVLARPRGVEVHSATPDGPVWARVEQVHAEQAIANLVHNAVAYSSQGGHVAVVLDRVDGGFELRVLDDGPGVEMKDWPRLTERTFRADAARARDGRGHGLGLAITGEVCRRAGWTLRFGPNEPRGFVVTLSGELADAPGAAPA